MSVELNIKASLTFILITTNERSGLGMEMWERPVYGKKYTYSVHCSVTNYEMFIDKKRKEKEKNVCMQNNAYFSNVKSTTNGIPLFIFIIKLVFYE